MGNAFIGIESLLILYYLKKNPFKYNVYTSWLFIIFGMNIKYRAYFHYRSYLPCGHIQHNQYAMLIRNKELLITGLECLHLCNIENKKNASTEILLMIFLFSNRTKWHLEWQRQYLQLKICIYMYNYLWFELHVHVFKVT